MTNKNVTYKFVTYNFVSYFYFMKVPFTYGKIAVGQDYTNRIKETKKLVSNFTSLTNTILISPRRWGKSSLVYSAAAKAMAKDKKLKICFIDLYNVKSEEEFYQQLSQEILKTTSGKIDEIMDMARKFLQMGFTRSRRYANHKSGKKYEGPVPDEMKRVSGAHGRKTLPPDQDPEKAKSAEIFFKFWKRAEADPLYSKKKIEWKQWFG